MLSMFQTMMTQQQVMLQMLQMLQMMMSRMMIPLAQQMPQMPPVPGKRVKPFLQKNRAPVNPPSDVQAAFQQQMEKYVS